MHVRVICVWLTFAALQASAIAAATALPAETPPTFLILPVLPTLAPRMRRSAPMTHAVRVPPPPLPRQKLTYVLLPRQVSTVAWGNPRLVTPRALPYALRIQCEIVLAFPQC